MKSSEPGHAPLLERATVSLFPFAAHVTVWRQSGRRKGRNLVDTPTPEMTIGGLPKVLSKIPNRRFDRALGLTMRAERFGPIADSDHHGANPYARASVAVRRCREGTNEHFAF